LVDLSYFWTAEGWLYVAVVLDFFSDRSAGTLLVIAVELPVGQRDP
jgi:transposase InsO family protein